MKGRPTIPSHLKILSGTFRPGRVNSSEPEPTALPSNSQPPCWLNAEAKKVWREIVQEVSAWLSIVDVEPLARWCALISDQRRLRNFLDKHGLTTSRLSVGGAVLGSQKRAEVSLLREIEKEIRSLEGVLGINASGRARMRLNSIQEHGTNDLDRQLFGD